MKRIAIVLLLASCHGGAVKNAGDAKLTVERLYPLRAGSVWSYDVDTGEGPPTLAITRVTHAGEGKAEVSSGGAPITYEQRSDGLFRADRGVYVLKEPLAQGTQWDVGQGGTASITAVGKHVSTVAGEFDGCLEVTESEPAAQKQVRTVFCPDVGPAEVESTITLQVSARGARVYARLRGYDFAGALGAPP
ncbi:MAG: hypothetical protein ABW352_00040 [Polyangiales bacterium]